MQHPGLVRSLSLQWVNAKSEGRWAFSVGGHLYQPWAPKVRERGGKGGRKHVRAGGGRGGM